ncbi:aminotransferase class V-fold PLP-dependent enzyme [Pelomonas sp. KK5]|uniref:aminotransferase class V-fold PLP-dependent enzyme n=1 Tax=Pelomonas sp. KK5 TaxID=1855730 RepID=UPI00097C7CC8|nr:aminotransferase class V-fold PLP-dependent enzyme [Pelomonas sp. KK5]
MDAARDQFDLAGACFLNAAFMHPLPRAAAAALGAYASARQGLPVNTQAARDRALSLFATMVGADADELAWVPSTTAGENMVVSALGLRQAGRIVTDELHFEGSLYLYQALAAQGRLVSIVPQREGAVTLEDMGDAIAPGTTLVAVSLVSAQNGFQHDLKRLCEIAHAQGALVFADIIQAAGATPIDLHDSGVDFACCASYKWLMGDFGAGFLYASRRAQKALKPMQQSYRQLQAFATHHFPFETPATDALSYRKREGAGALFELGTLSNSAAIAMCESLPLLLDLGIERIEAHRQPMLELLQRELTPARGFTPLTPRGNRSALVAFAAENAQQRFAGPLAEAGVHIQLHPHRLRISPSIYNDMADIERLLDVLR